MKRNIEVNTKQIKTFLFDMTKDKEEAVDEKVNKFLSKLDGEETEVSVFPQDTYLVVTVIYEIE